MTIAEEGRVGELLVWWGAFVGGDHFGVGVDEGVDLFDRLGVAGCAYRVSATAALVVVMTVSIPELCITIHVSFLI